MLSELKKRAIEADNAFSSFEECFSDWGSILTCSEKLAPLLSLNISEESKKTLTSMVDVASVLESTFAELEAKRDELVLEYALAEIGGSLGDIVDYVDKSGKKNAIIIESMYMFGDDFCIYGTRFLKSGHKGSSQGSFKLGDKNWKLRE